MHRTISASYSAPALEMQEVTVTSLRDPSQIVLEGVNFRVQKGEYWVITGLLRSGKSDLMATAAGLMRPRKGIVRIFGRERGVGFEGEWVAMRRRVGVVFDGGQLLHDLTLAENIALPLQYHGMPHRPADDRQLAALIAFADLEPWMNRHPGEINRNWQQRIGLARALALKPERLVVERPLSSLEPWDIDWWLEKIAALHRGHALVDEQPMTIVVTDHDLRPWVSRATHFAMLKSGQFVSLGTRAEVAERLDLLLRDLLPTPRPAP
jgi:ABC-type transporter Mla maintaining outer membrane lipid asymmetry ATPase subunit MlaF